MMEDNISLRRARNDDAASLARLWIEFGRYYWDLDSAQFQVPREDGLADWFEARLATSEGDDSVSLVAERHGRVVGAIQAQVWRPSPEADRQLVREVGEMIPKVDSVIVTEQERRSGIGRALMEAVETWGRYRGASQAVVISYAESPTSVPFYENGLGYGRKTIGFWKALG